PGAAGVCGAPEDRVHEARGAASPGQPDAAVDRRVGGHAVQEEQLVEPEPQRRAHRRVELLERPAYEPAEVMVETTLPGEGPVDEPGRERVVGRGERRARETIGEEHVGEGLAG